MPELEEAHTGRCHCGAVRFRFTLRTLDALDCTCSIGRAGDREAARAELALDPSNGAAQQVLRAVE